MQTVPRPTLRASLLATCVTLAACVALATCVTPAAPRPAAPDPGPFYRQPLAADMRCYHTFDQVVAELDRLHAARPDLVARKVALGSSWEGRTIWAVKISDHPELEEDEPAVIYDALHHAREPVGMETLLHTMRTLVERYDEDASIRYLVDERQLWFVPVVNPDGYAHNGIGGLQRKNRRPNADGSFGVDLNRNYDCRWGYDDLGSSPVPSSQTYRGPAPFSEPETRALRDFILDHTFVTGMTLHAYSNVSLLPGGWAAAHPPDWADLCELGADLRRLTGYPFGQPWELLYFSNGRAQDWAHEQAGVLMIEPEIGSPADGFWPPGARLRSLVAENLPALLHVARIAGAHVEAVSTRLVGGRHGPGALAAGEGGRLEITLRNKGYGAARALGARLVSRTPGLTVDPAHQALGDLPARSNLAPGALSVPLALAPAVAGGAELELELELRGAGGYTSTQTLHIMAGVPELLFADGGEDWQRAWRTNDGWGPVELAGASGGRAYADSPRGPYRAGSDNALILRRALDLSDFAAAYLTFRERYFVEPWADPCRVEAATGAGAWVTLSTLAGGTQPSFHERRLALAAFAGRPAVRLRFRITDNGINQRDGWTIDDIRVWGYRRSAAVETAAAPAPVDPGATPPAGTLALESE